MTAWRKTFNYIKILCLCVLVGAYFLWLFGVRIFNLPKIEVPFLNQPFFYYAISLILFQSNILFLQLIVFGYKNKKDLLWSLTGIPFCIASIFIPSEIITFGFPVAFICFLRILKRKDCKDTKWYKDKLIIFAIVFSLITAYDYLAFNVKINLFEWQLNNLNTIDKLIFSIDLFLFYGILYLTFNKKGVKSNGLENILGKFFRPINKPKQEIQQVSPKNLNFTGKLIFFSIVIFAQLFQFALVLLIAKINNRVIEVVVITAALVPLRTFILKDTIHAKTFWGCTVITCFIFWALIRLTPPLSVSIFSGIIVTCLFVLVLHYIAIQNFNIYAMSESELKQYCQSKKITDNMQAFVIGKVIHGLKGIQLADFVGCGIDSLEYYSKITRKRLGINKWND